MSDGGGPGDERGSCAGHDGHHHLQGPPSAAGPLEPYGARVSLRAATAGFDPQPFLAQFLNDLAAGCMDSGATVIGHFKCFLHLPGGGIACNLTSRRAGATCSFRGAAAPATLPAGEAAELALVVLVYGLPEDAIDALVRAGLSRLLDPRDVSWSLPLSPPQ